MTVATNPAHARSRPDIVDDRKPALTANSRRAQLLGLGVDTLTLCEVEATIEGFVARGGAHQVVTLNLDFLSIARRDPRFHALVREADLVVADGMPVVWASRYLGTPIPQRITGPDLIELSVRHSLRVGSSLFFLGAAPGLGQLAADVLSKKLGRFNLAGAYAPPFDAYDAAEDRKVRAMLSDARPDFLFVAFGCPRQDFWIQEHRDLNVPVAIGVGGSFDLLSGAIRRAPRWMQQSGLEWAYRLGREPTRLAKRYLVDDTPVAAHLILSKFSAKGDGA